MIKFNLLHDVGQKRNIEKKNDELFSMKSVRDVMESMEKINKEKKAYNKKLVNQKSVDTLTKLALQEIKVLLEAKRIRKKRNALKRKITKKMK